MLNKTIPGTLISYENYEESIESFREMITITGGLSLGQMCSMTGLQTSTIQNWVKRGYVPHPTNKMYYERHIARILIIASLKDCMNIDDICYLMELINGDTDDEDDDIVDETDLYTYLSKIINSIDINNYSDIVINNIISKILKKEKLHKEKLSIALKVMTYAYLSGQYLKITNNYLDELVKIGDDKK